MSPMPALSHQVVGLIDVPSDAWSADALVRDCLGIVPRAKERDRFITGRRGTSAQLERDDVAADFSQLRDDLDQLLEHFLMNCQE
jgi:hypothetical protein